MQLFDLPRPALLAEMSQAKCPSRKNSSPQSVTIEAEGGGG